MKTFYETTSPFHDTGSAEEKPHLENRSKIRDDQTRLRVTILTCQDSKFAFLPFLFAMTLHRLVIVDRVLHVDMSHVMNDAIVQVRAAISCLILHVYT